MLLPEYTQYAELSERAFPDFRRAGASSASSPPDRCRNSEKPRDDCGKIELIERHGYPNKDTRVFRSNAFSFTNLPD